MRQRPRWALCGVGFLVGLGVLGLGVGWSADAPADEPDDSDQPAVFQAAGPTAESIQSMVDAFRAALGDPNNANAPGPLTTGRREINWDGGGADDTTTPPVTPFNVFLNIRGGQFTTPGEGLSQAPPEGGPQGGLAELFDNPTYGDIFTPFSPLRLFTPVGSNITEGLFFIPGSNGKDPATVRGFGAVFTDVDRPDGGRRDKKDGHHEAGTRGDQPDGGRRDKKDGHRQANTQIEYFDADGKRLFRGVVPASPGDGSLSFFGLVFDDARIARVRITTGNVAPGPDDDAKHDVVMMDDFLYGEPQPLRDKTVRQSTLED